jgi:hypothetical protein
MVVIRLIRPGFIYHWLIASLGSFLAWVMVLLIPYEPPFSILLGIWQPKLLVSASPIFQIDQISWSFAVAIVTLAVGVIFTDVSRPDGTSWFSWTSILFLSACGLFAVFAGNPLTLMMSWMLLDLAQFVILLKENSGNDSSRYLPIELAFRFMGTIILMISGFISIQSNQPFSFSYNDPIVISLLLLSVFFRIGSFPYHSPVLAHPQSRRSLGTTTRLVSVASALVLLPRIAAGIKSSGVHLSNEAIVLFVIGGLALLASIAWMISKDEMDGRSYWILGIALLAIASTLRSEPEAAMAWGLAGILTGGLLFVASFRDKRIVWIPLLGVLMISALPFSPTWNVAFLFNPPFTISHLLFFFSLVFLLSGYIKHARNLIGSMSGLERWVWLIYPMGLIVIIITDFWLGWQTKPMLDNVTILEWLVGLIVLAISIALLFAFKWYSLIPPTYSSKINTVFSLVWIYGVFHYIYVFLRTILNFITRVLEGEGGILWTLLWVAVILAILGIQLGG